MLAHTDDVARVDHLDALPRRAAEQVADVRLPAHEHELGGSATRPIQERAPDDLVRGVVATHGIDGDAHFATRWRASP